MTIISNIVLAYLFELIGVLASVAYLTLLERKLMAGIQRRRGPNRTGIWGTLQPFADGLKLFTKEMFMPVKANRIIFLMAPTIFLSFSLINWILMPLGYSRFDFGYFICINNLIVFRFWVNSGPSYRIR